MGCGASVGTGALVLHTGSGWKLLALCRLWCVEMLGECRMYRNPCRCRHDLALLSARALACIGTLPLKESDTLDKAPILDKPPGVHL